MEYLLNWIFLLQKRSDICTGIVWNSQESNWKLIHFSIPWYAFLFFPNWHKFTVWSFSWQPLSKMKHNQQPYWKCYHDDHDMTTNGQTDGQMLPTWPSQLPSALSSLLRDAKRKTLCTVDRAGQGPAHSIQYTRVMDYDKDTWQKLHKASGGWWQTLWNKSTCQMNPRIAHKPIGECSKLIISQWEAT